MFLSVFGKLDIPALGGPDNPGGGYSVHRGADNPALEVIFAK